MHDIAGEQPRVNSQNGLTAKKSTVTVCIEPDGRIIKLEGRPAWMLRELVKAGKRGVTTIELPAGVRISHYVMMCRRAGLTISSPRESHGGEFSGSHSRYCLETDVTILDDMSAAA
ncbi:MULTISPECIES: hypothetical protein [unclassified Mesorhizobium]|uniref:winged helix domain-containing protein n=1 Tax=unclassified Mesorhizobium TaxID=325217 RepID=UPI0003D03304|nr:MULTISPECIES: hypothetical protein [unclassified Mesorhizobium]ESZ06475.1 hypothetical protein X736_10930 [Mesorhizobium sp. L2C089B000]WJI52553.1 hypothetical protein NLY44_07755 [Mesorhizobium sp. C089B]